ncbi:TPA_exp: Uncharacterized protein A8136_4761 [Trichophyton benhamiae CBS 112371]|uniref:FHA domain-containing protein n=1 Tax=Arthroderma benhamiae (strain ATCC MYA-4681 / CBS 112371) TaxID=663331 RepID=D4B371_ARTBC|nr:uncharacterized protein ARB_02905 [Trichophyton benhamiae CBS 112371]EFE30226.1 hypothetical protein ARB_02905 [Trichophyton benhamiae CBS 112371]DAA73451.1 TPA_exp: Uncharacterized protein A8136_4761 [Trichophyton benhamiae CBS 112371]
MPRYEESHRSHRRKSRSPSSHSREDRGRPKSRGSKSQRHRSLSPDGRKRSRGPRGRKSHRYRSRSVDSSDASHSRTNHLREPRRKSRDRRRNDRDGHRSHRRREGRERSASPSRKPYRRSPSPQVGRRSDKPLPSQQDAFSKTPRDGSGQATPVGEKEKEKANYGNTGRLAADTNTVRSSDGTTSIVLKYNEPPEARKPPAKDAWRLYIFKDDNLLETIELGDRSCWLIGKEKLVADLPIDHPSCSKQHAAIQFRYVEKRNDFGDRDGRVRPYLIDLESANGTTVNGDPAPARRYMELMDKDVLKFGLSTREYVLLLPPPS